MKKMMKKQMIALLFGVCISTALYAQESVKVEAESLADKSEKAMISTRKTGETVVTNFNRGQWIKLENVDFGSGKNQMKVRAASGAKSNKAGLTIRQDATNGAVIGKVKVPVDGWGKFTEVDVKLSKEVSGKKDIYVLSRDGGVMLDWIEFIK